MPFYPYHIRIIKFLGWNMKSEHPYQIQVFPETIGKEKKKDPYQKHVLGLW